MQILEKVGLAKRSSVEDLERRLGEVSEKHQTAEGTIHSLRHDVSVLRSESGGLHQELASLRTAHQALNKKLADTERRAGELQNEVQAAVDSGASSVKVLEAHRDAAQERARAAERWVEELQTELEAARDNHANRIDHMQLEYGENLKDEQTRRAGLERELANVRSDLEEEREAHQATRTTLATARMEAVEASRAAVAKEDRIAALSRSLADVRAAQEQVELNLRAAMQNARAEAGREASARDARDAQLRGRITSLEAEIRNRKG